MSSVGPFKNPVLLDYCRQMGLMAERALDWRPELIGVARYEPYEKDTAEVALVVQGYWQGKGLGSILLKEILRAGEANGIRAFPRPRAGGQQPRARHAVALDRYPAAPNRTRGSRRSVYLSNTRPTGVPKVALHQNL